MEATRHYIYKITLLCGSMNGYYYLGKHSTNARWDSYTGSGRVVRDYFKKYGAKKGVTYEKEILEYNADKETNNKREAEIIGDLWKTDCLCLNLRAGGDGGQMASGEDNPNYGKKRTDETRKKISLALKGKAKSEEHKKICRQAAIGHTPWNKGKSYKNDKDSASMKTKWQDEEYRRKCSESHLGQISARRRPVLSKNIETGKIEFWECIQQAVEALGLKTHSNISSCLNGRRDICCGRVWNYV